MVDLQPVDVDDPRIQRLLQLYIYEWSGRLAIPIQPDARFAYDNLERYRQSATRVVVLFIDPGAGTPLGFGLIMRDATERWHVEEFFVLAGARRRGVGRAAAQALFVARPGRWTLTVRQENAEALSFWRRTVPPGAEEQVEPGTDGVKRTRISFESRAPRRPG